MWFRLQLGLLISLLSYAVGISIVYCGQKERFCSSSVPCLLLLVDQTLERLIWLSVTLKSLRKCFRLS